MFLCSFSLLTNKANSWFCKASSEAVWSMASKRKEGKIYPLSLPVTHILSEKLTPKDFKYCALSSYGT